MDKTKFTANPHLDSEGFSNDGEAQLSTMSFGDPLFEPGQHEIRQALVKGIWPWLQPNMSHVQIKRDLVERRHRARAANEPGIKVDDVFTTEQAALALKAIQHVTDVARCEGCTPQACTWTDLSDEEIEAQHRHWQTMGNGWSGA